MTQRKYTHRTPEQWQAYLDQQAQSGLSVKDYCQEQSLAPSNFYSWRKKLSVSPVNNTESNEPWIAVTPTRPPTDSTPQCSTEICLALPGGIQLTITSY
jgi:putative transposase